MNLRILQLICLLSAGSLFALTGLRQFFSEPLAHPLPNALWFLIQVLPILLVVPGIVRLKPRSFLLAALAAMLYFGHGVLVSVTPDQRASGLWEVGFALILILSAAFSVRHLREAGA